MSDSFAEASYNSVYGEVKSGWKKDGENIIFSVTVPANCRATVILPDGSQRQVDAGTYEF